MLNTALAQSIVDRTMAVLHINVNIMDVNGVVIAAGNEQRIGTFHSTAAQVIASGRKRTVTAAQAARLEGVKPGVTLPIVYKDEIIGALGMTGEPEQVEKYGELVVLSALLMIEQEETKERVFQEQRARESFLFDLLSGHCQENEKLFLQRAALLGFRFDRPCAVMAIQISQVECSRSILDDQKLKDDLEAYLSGRTVQGAEIISSFFNDHLAILCPIGPRADTSGESLRRLAEKLLGLLSERLPGDILLGVGGVCRQYAEISTAFTRAVEALRLAERYRKCRSGIAFFEDFITEYTLLRIPKGDRRIFCTAVLGGLLACKEDQRELYLGTLHTYFENDMNVQKTAAMLFIHRNTLNMRLAKVKELTGYSPQQFREAFALRMAMTLLRMDEDK